MSQKHVVAFGLAQVSLDDVVRTVSANFPNTQGTTKIAELSEILTGENVDILVIEKEVPPELRIAIRGLLTSQGLDIDIVEPENSDDVLAAIARIAEQYSGD